VFYVGENCKGSIVSGKTYHQRIYIYI
jgi:hypothetical protein